jgi:3-oxoacyl-[acyl-carrier protein] reductase
MRLFAKNGSNVFACARTVNQTFEDECRLLGSQNAVSVVPLYFDVTDKDQTRLAVDSIKEKAEKIDILVNNAGMAQGGLFRMTPVDVVKNVFEVNFFAQLDLTQLIVKSMIKQKSGAIVNVASVAGLDGRRGTIAYGSSKSALILATKTMALELGMSGIRVNAVAPGIIRTDMFEAMDEKARSEMMENNALRRCGSSDEVANAIMFLASGMSSYITGQTIRVDGGL